MNDTPTTLLIEDDEGIAEPLVFGLQSEGMQVLCAVNGAQGLALARSEQPDVILLDVVLPNMDGLESQAEIIANALREPVERESDGEGSSGRSLDALIASYAQDVGGRLTLADADLT